MHASEKKSAQERCELKPLDAIKNEEPRSRRDFHISKSTVISYYNKDKIIRIQSLHISK